MAEEQKLLPCPFCGNHDVHIFHAGDVEYVQCLNCTTCGPDHIGDKHWNCRVVVPNDPQPQPTTTDQEE